MAKKTTDKLLDDAIALFRSGKSPRECDKLTGVNYKKVEREAKKRGVTKGDVSHLVVSMASDKRDFVSLPVSVQDIVSKAVDKQLEGMEFYATNARKVVKMGLMSLKDDPTPSGMKTVMEGMKTGMAVEGLVPYYPNAVINNTNAQQNVEPVRFTRAEA
jgi:hypothetical protein